MSHLAGPPVAVLDANVLYPFLVRDLLLSFAHQGLFRAHWSTDIMDEWTRHLIERRPDRQEQILRTARLMNEAFPDASVEGHEALIAHIDLPDRDDRHVLAAAIKAGADVIVTANLADFPAERLSPHQIEACSADDFLFALFERSLDEALAAVRQMRARYNEPPFSPEKLVVGLHRADLVRTAAGLKRHMGTI